MLGICTDIWSDVTDLYMVNLKMYVCGLNINSLSKGSSSSPLKSYVKWMGFHNFICNNNLYAMSSRW